MSKCEILLFMIGGSRRREYHPVRSPELRTTLLEVVRTQSILLELSRTLPTHARTRYVRLELLSNQITVLYTSKQAHTITMFNHIHCYSRSFAPLLHVSLVISLVILQLPPSDLAGLGVQLSDDIGLAAGSYDLCDTTASTSLVCCVTCWSLSPEDSVFFLIFLRFLLLSMGSLLLA